MLPETLWRNPELLQSGYSVFGLPCQLDGNTGGSAEWTEGPLQHVKVNDASRRVQLKAQGKGQGRIFKGQTDVRYTASPHLITVESDSLGKALSALALSLAVKSGLLSEESAREENVYQQWRRAGETEHGAQRLLQIILYSTGPGAKSYEGLVDFGKLMDKGV